MFIRASLRCQRRKPSWAPLECLAPRAVRILAMAIEVSAVPDEGIMLTGTHTNIRMLSCGTSRSESQVVFKSL